MLRAMSAGISGLMANQDELDVIGNNIANSETTAFRSQRIRFEDTLSQTMSQGTGSTATSGGTNPQQVGLGTKVAGIDTDTTEGNLQPTNSNLDFAVDGTGYFVVGNGDPSGVISLTTPSTTAPITINGTASATQMSDIKYTRDGAFQLDANGNLLTSNGYRVMGYALGTTPSVDYSNYATNGKPTINYVNANDNTVTKNSDQLVPLVIPKQVTENGNLVNVVSYSVDSNGVIKAVLSDNNVAALGQIAMASFNNDAGLTKAGNDLYEKSTSSGDANFRSAVNESTAPNDSAFGNINENELEMSNVNLAEQFSNMIVASRNFQADGKIITTSDQIYQTLVNLKQ